LPLKVSCPTCTRPVLIGNVLIFQSLIGFEQNPDAGQLAGWVSTPAQFLLQLASFFFCQACLSLYSGKRVPEYGYGSN
jgi:hypothetical protein